tara:strand:+ start:404 stop:2086 length:1683 start_codon:yes stop_codon:yes gene_type:complete
MLNQNNFNNTITKKGLFFLPLGGVGEIGANCYLYCCNNSWIMIDLGVSFADEKYPGIDLLVPKLNFLDHIKDQLQGIIISHAHEDHAGAISFFTDKINCPVYASEFAYNLINRRLKENQLSNKINLEKININKKLEFKNFIISFFETNHSIPEPFAIKIDTEYGNILHTADWKIDKNPLIGNVLNSSSFKEMGQEGILALVGDSTNASTTGYSGSEEDVRNHFIKLFSRYNKRIVATCFSSNITRLESIAYAAKRNNRKVAIVGRSINRTIEAARESGYLKNIDEFISQEEAQYVPKDNIVIICTGSQGEKRSALFRIAYNSHPYIHLEKEDVVIFSSRDIPGNEKSINNLKNLLVRQKVEILTSNEELVHVSGHAYTEELKNMYQWIRPFLAVPIHGEPMHLLEHAKIAQSCQVPFTKILDNGSLLKIAPDKPEVIDKISTGKMIVEGGRTYNSESDFIKERLKYSYEGIVMITLLINKDYTLNKDIVISHFGLPIDNISKLSDSFKMEFIDEYLKIINNKKNKENNDVIISLSKKVVRKYCMREFKRKPEVQTHIVRI